MDKMLAIAILAGMCGVVLLITLLKKRLQVVLEFFLRMGLGATCILWMNGILVKQGIACSVGINFISLLTSGSLGLPGVALLYAIILTKNL